MLSVTGTRVTPHLSCVYGQCYSAFRCQPAADILVLPPRSCTEELLSGPFNNWSCGHQGRKRYQPDSSHCDSSRMVVLIEHKILHSKGPDCPSLVMLPSCEDWLFYITGGGSSRRPVTLTELPCPFRKAHLTYSNLKKYQGNWENTLMAHKSDFRSTVSQVLCCGGNGFVKSHVPAPCWGMK